MEGARALIQPETALQRINSPGRYAFSSPDGTPVSSLDLGATSRHPQSLAGKSPEASPLGADDAVTPASSIGVGPRVHPIMRTLSGASSGSELGLAAAMVAPEVQKPTSTADGSGSDIESIRLSKAQAAPPQGQRNMEASDSDSGAASLTPLRSLGCLVPCTPRSSLGVAEYSAWMVQQRLEQRESPPPLLLSTRGRMIPGGPKSALPRTFDVLPLC